MPERIRLSRRAGWRLADGARSVARPHLFGNPFTEDDFPAEGRTGDWRRAVVDAFRAWLTGEDHRTVEQDRRARLLDRLEELRGLHLACWCPLDGPCHADVLLDLANRPRSKDD
ncbi:MAG: DUF4326 domain-containing protein [Thalassobaculaceae bacterium]|nr:DUF4326 domain-containing protein [Thalassobaculaceae bacterium]